MKAYIADADNHTNEYAERVRRALASSEDAPPESTGPLPVVGSGGAVGGRGIESEIIRVATALEHNAMTREAIVGEWLPLDGFQNQLQLEARAMRESAKILRRHVASENERQPEPNAASQTAAPNTSQPKS